MPACRADSDSMTEPSMMMHLSPIDTMLCTRHDRSMLPAPIVTASPMDVLAGIPVEAACLHMTSFMALSDNRRALTAC